MAWKTWPQTPRSHNGVEVVASPTAQPGPGRASGGLWSAIAGRSGGGYPPRLRLRLVDHSSEDFQRSDDDREVDMTEDERPVLPDQTRDDTDRGWGERHSDDSNDERLLRERPPHW
jgi:hypothetical protein